MRFRVAPLFLVLPLVSSCSEPPTAPTADPTPVYISELFSGSLEAGASSFFSYSVSVGGTVSVMLATLTGSAGQPLPQSVKLGVGTPNGTDCGVTFVVTASAALTSQISNYTPPGTYCVNVSDPGTLTSAANFNIRIVHP